MIYIFVSTSLIFLIMRKILLLILSVIASLTLFGQGDNYWKPNVNTYPTNMSVIAVVSLSEVEQRDAMIELGAFYSSDNELDGELRGSKRLVHIQTQNGTIDRYMAHITIYGNAGDVITFRLYNHELGEELAYITEQTIVFEVDGTMGTNENPLVLDFAKHIITDEMLADAYSSDDVFIDGDINIVDGRDISVKSLKIAETKSLTIQDGGVLTVNETLTNTDVDALVIEEGGQLIHHNADVAATFRNEIVVPSGTWGEEDNTGWQFISSPVENANTADFIPANGDYDLYMYNGTNEYQWQNFKLLGSQSYDFSTDPFNNGWTAIDADGDGWNWVYKAGRMKYMQSSSFDGEDDIKVENYLISPQMIVNNGMILSFDARITYEYDEEFGELPETFKVLLSTESNDNPSYFTVELGDYSITNNEYETFEIDLSEYNGRSVYVAFYHYLKDVGSENLIIDNVEFVNENSFEKGRGYLVSYQNEDNVAEFKGNLNYLAKGESYQIDLNHYPENILAQFNLIGNPFAFDLTWENDVDINNVYDGFATLDATNGGYVYKENGTIKAGEGFMVRTNETGNNYIRFTKASRRSYRAESNSINIIASNDKGSDNVIIRFDDEVKSGFPKLANFNERLANIYVKEENVNYGILNFNTAIDEIPLYFDAKEMGNYTLTFDIKGDYDNLYLLDKMTSEKVNLLLENEYSFIANSNDNTDRFVLMFDNGQQTTDNIHFVYVSGEELIINAEGTIQIVDMMGRVVMTEENHNGSINISELNNAAYIVRCVNENEVRTQKIVVL